MPQSIEKMKPSTKLTETTNYSGVRWLDLGPGHRWKMRFGLRGRGARPETLPDCQWQATKKDNHDLAGIEKHQPFESRVHEAIAVQADAEHVDAEPGERGHDVAEDGEIHQPAVAHQAAPAGVQNHRVPNYDQQRAILF